MDKLFWGMLLLFDMCITIYWGEREKRAIDAMHNMQSSMTHTIDELRMSIKAIPEQLYDKHGNKYEKIIELPSGAIKLFLHDE